jgi:uncharacterized repeat protein (TIGR01451 family)
MAPDLSQRPVDGLPPDRRQFLARLLLGAAYAAPIVASFSLDGLLVEPARAQASNLCANTGAVCGKPAIANVAINVTASPQTAASGDTITYTVTAINCGPCTATNVSFLQIIPQGTGFLSATQLTGPTFTLSKPTVGFPGRVTGGIGSLAAGVSATFEIKATVF